MKIFLFFLISSFSTVQAAASKSYDYSIWSNFYSTNQCYKKISMTSTHLGQTRSGNDAVEWMEIVPSNNQWYMDKNKKPLGILVLNYYDKNYKRINLTGELLVATPRPSSFLSIVSGDIFFKNRPDFPAFNLTQIVELSYSMNGLYLLNTFKSYEDRPLTTYAYDMKIIDHQACPEFSDN